MAWIRSSKKAYAKTGWSPGLKPLARSEALVIEELGDEVLVYDLTANRAHSLSATAAQVWRACDGETTVGSLRDRLPLDAETVARALSELRECALLDVAPLNGGMTRRDMTLKAAKLSAAAASIPLIWSVAGPIPEAAATPAPEECLRYTDKDCDGCRSICGCCCCCQAGDCKTCYPTNLCPEFNQCPGGQESKCSAEPPAECNPVGTVVPCKPPNQNQVTRPCCDPFS